MVAQAQFCRSGLDMASITITPLSGELSFGARVAGIDRDNVTDEAVRAQLNALFEERGVIVFEGVEPDITLHGLRIIWQRNQIANP